MEQSEKVLHHVFDTHIGGLIRFYIVIWSILSQFKWPLLFLHHAWRGRGTLLGIRTKHPNNHSDTESGTLSKICVLNGMSPDILRQTNTHIIKL